jgi:hypothetical protein
MSKEHANQQVRDGNAIPVGVVRVGEDIVKKLMREHANVSYVTTEDVKDLIDRAVKQLNPIAGESTADYTYGIETIVVSNILCAILRVPKAKSTKSENKLFKDKSQDEINNYKAHHLEAADIAKTIRVDSSVISTYEDFDQSVKNSADPKKIKRILLASAPGSEPLQLPTGEILPEISVSPKCLSSCKTFSVQLDILSVHDKEHEAMVTLKEVAIDPNSTLVHLVEKDLYMTFGKSKKDKAIRKVLVGMQLVHHPVRCKVSATLALRSRDRRLNRLNFIGFENGNTQQETVAKALQQVSLDL